MNRLRPSWYRALTLPATLFALVAPSVMHVPARAQEDPRDRSARRLQIDRAAELSIPVEFSSKADCTLHFRLIPAGSFQMGSERIEIKARANVYTKRELTFTLATPPDEMLHRVTLTRDFYMGVTEVTNAQFRRFRPDHNSGQYKGTIHVGKFFSIATPEYDLNGEDQPVGSVTWFDAMSFCDWLSERENVPKGTYRLPTEAEWEYSCRAGTVTQYVWGDDPEDAKGWDNFCDESASRGLKPLPFASVDWDDGYVVSAPVGRFKANSWGLFDMPGNVEEWCMDIYAKYPSKHVIDPETPLEQLRLSQAKRVVRGANWAVPMWMPARSATRSAFEPRSREGAGFRVVRQLVNRKRLP